MLRKVGIVAVEFGFGPVSKAAYIIQELQRVRPNLEMVFWGGKHGIEYIDRLNLGISICRRENIVKDYDCDCLINVMDVDLLKEWVIDGCMYFVDSLTWMWNMPLIGMEKIRTYFIQDYLVQKEMVEEVCKYVKTITIPPISTELCEVKKDGGILVVNFSGVHNPYVSKSFYFKYCSEITMAILELAGDRYDSIYFTMNEEMAEMIRKKHHTQRFKAKIHYCMLRHDEFISLIQRADRVITNPGITTIIELIRNNCAFALLMGSNFSQVRMTSKYKKERCLDNIISIEELGYNTDCLEAIPEEEGIEAVVRMIEEVLQNKMESIKTFLSHVISMRRNDLLIQSKMLQICSGQGQVKIVEEILRDFGVD